VPAVAGFHLLQLLLEGNAGAVHTFGAGQLHAELAKTAHVLGPHAMNYFVNPIAMATRRGIMFVNHSTGTEYDTISLRVSHAISAIYSWILRWRRLRFSMLLQ